MEKHQSGIARKTNKQKLSIKSSMERAHFFIMATLSEQTGLQDLSFNSQL